MNRYLLLLLSFVAGDSVRGHGGELAHATLGALDRFGDSAAGTLHGAVFCFAIEGTAHCVAGGFDLLGDGERVINLDSEIADRALDRSEPASLF